MLSLETFHVFMFLLDSTKFLYFLTSFSRRTSGNLIFFVVYDSQKIDTGVIHIARIITTNGGSRTRGVYYSDCFIPGVRSINGRVA